MVFIVKLSTNYKRPTWQIVGGQGDVPEGLQIGVNGGYAGIWSAVADVLVDGKLQSRKARVLRTWTERLDENSVEQTRFAEVEVDL